MGDLISARFADRGTGTDNIERFQHAMKADLGRPPQETIFLELAPIITQAVTAYKNVTKWAAPDGVPFNINTFALKGRVFKDPHGVSLIIGPFNYPLVRICAGVKLQPIDSTSLGLFLLTFNPRPFYRLAVVSPHPIREFRIFSHRSASSFRAALARSLT
jgi:hypothetical protein